MNETSPSLEKAPSHVKPHSFVAKVIHWGFIVFFIYALTKQLDEVEELEDFALLQFEMVFATIFLALIVMRYVYMHFVGATALPSNTPRMTMLMARFVHVAMYVGLAMIAISGLMIGGLYWSNIKSGIVMDGALLLHEISVNGSYSLIGLHILAAVYHRFKRDGIWNSMVPVWKEKASE